MGACLHLFFHRTCDPLHDRQPLLVGRNPFYLRFFEQQSQAGPKCIETHGKGENPEIGADRKVSSQKKTGDGGSLVTQFLFAGDLDIGILLLIKEQGIIDQGISCPRLQIVSQGSEDETQGLQGKTGRVEHDGYTQNSRDPAQDPARFSSPEVCDDSCRDFHEEACNVVDSFQYAEFDQGETLEGKVDHPDPMGEVQG